MSFVACDQLPRDKHNLHGSIAINADFSVGAYESEQLSAANAARVYGLVTRDPADPIKIAGEMRTASATYAAAVISNVKIIAVAAVVALMGSTVDRFASVERAAMHAETTPACHGKAQVRSGV